MRYSGVALLMTLAVGCAGEDERPAAGSELGPCQDGFCLEPLVCAPENICVDPAQLGDTGSDEGSDATGSSASGAAPTSGGESTSGADTNADGGAADGGAADGGAEGGADGGAADGGAADSGDGDAPPPACVQYGAKYCSCLGEAAAPTCVSGATESCADVYDLCPSYWTCVNANVASCNLDNAECSCG